MLSVIAYESSCFIIVVRRLKTGRVTNGGRALEVKYYFSVENRGLSNHVSIPINLRMVQPRFTVYMWGFQGNPSPISPGCVALYWFLNGYYAREASVENIELCFANNTDLSPEGELPLLISDDGNKISGFVNIIVHLTKCGGLKSDGSELLQSALLQFTSTELTVLTEYQLYLNKYNYEKFTRNAFTHLLYWPMWYNTPIKYRTAVREKCDGILQYSSHEDDPDFVGSEVSKSQDPADLAQSKTFKVAQQKKKLNKEELQNVRQNLIYLNKLGECLKKWIQIRERSLAEKIIPADLLMWANVYVQLQLPDSEKISNHLTEALGSEIFDSLRKQLEVCSNFEPAVAQREPNFHEQGNAIMTIYNGVRKYV